MRIFDGPLTQETMDAIEDSLKAMNVDIKKGSKTGKKSVVKGTT